MPSKRVDVLLELWAASLVKHDDVPPFKNHDAMHKIIDSIQHGSAPWTCFKAAYTGARPTNGPVPSWMDDTYEIWFRNPQIVLDNMLNNPDFAEEFDYAAYKQANGRGRRAYKDFFSGDWVWRQSVRQALHNSASPQLIDHFNRMKLRQTPTPQAASSFPSSSAATRPQFRWQLARTNITRCTSPLGTFITTFAALIVNPLFRLPFSRSPNVSFLFISFIFVILHP